MFGWGLNARIDRFLDHLFFGGLELCVLSTPVLLLLLVATPAGAVSLSALATLCVGSTAVALFRGGYLDRLVRWEWPRPGEIGSFPGRSAYYGLVVGAGTFAGVHAQQLTGVFWSGLVVPAFVAVALVAVLPPALSWLSRASRADPPWS